uniref:Uncharacterized protein n=1 Tax=Medicago truncatula TaxID=3880 RepID=Q1RU76_MEDTR|nr:hypothetical protein MtrDRAFT_AC153123g5v2 [Medicago truncatula]
MAHERSEAQEKTVAQTHEMSSVKDVNSTTHVNAPSTAPSSCLPPSECRHQLHETLDVGEDEILHEFDVYSHSSLDVDEMKVMVKPIVRPDPPIPAIEFDVKSLVYMTKTTLLTSINQAPAMDVVVGVFTRHEVMVKPTVRPDPRIPAIEFDVKSLFYITKNVNGN